MIRIQAKELQKAVENVARPKGKTGARAWRKVSKYLPVLSHVLIRYDPGTGRILVATHDLTDPLVEYAHPLHNRDVVPFATCVPTRPFTDWLRIAASYNDTLELDHDAAREILRIYSGPSRTAFKCINAREFPPISIIQ